MWLHRTIKIDFIFDIDFGEWIIESQQDFSCVVKLQAKWLQVKHWSHWFSLHIKAFHTCFYSLISSALMWGTYVHWLLSALLKLVKGRIQSAFNFRATVVLHALYALLSCPIFINKQRWTKHSSLIWPKCVEFFLRRLVSVLSQRLLVRKKLHSVTPL